MASAIDPTKPVDGVPSVKVDLRNNLQATKTEIESLQAGKADLGHQHLIGDLTDAGVLAAKDIVGTGDIAAGAVTANQLANAAVITAKLNDGAVTQTKLATGAVGAAQLQDGIPINMLDQLLTRPQLKAFSEARLAPASAAGTLTLDLGTANVFEVTLSENITALVFTNAPPAGSAGELTLILKQDAVGGRTLAWPGSVRWPGGVPPAITSVANAVDIHSFVTTNGGATWFGFPGGQDFN